MTIKRTGPLKWKLLGPVGHMEASILILIFLFLLSFAVSVIYFTIQGVAEVTNMPFWIVAIFGLLTTLECTVNNRRIALLPEFFTSIVVYLMVITAVFAFWDDRPGALVILISYIMLTAITSFIKMTSSFKE